MPSRPHLDQADPAVGPADESQAGWGIRILAIFVDWIACYLVCVALFGTEQVAHSSFDPLVAYFLEASLSTGLFGASFGQMATRLRVESVGSGGSIGLLRAVVRTALICVVIPPLVAGPDGRGLHDKAVGSRVTRLARPR